MFELQDWPRNQIHQINVFKLQDWPGDQINQINVFELQDWPGNQINQINVFELQDWPRNQRNIFPIKQIIYLQIFLYIAHIFDWLLSLAKNCDACCDILETKIIFFILNLSHYRFPVKTLAVRTVGQKI